MRYGWFLICSGPFSDFRSSYGPSAWVKKRKSIQKTWTDANGVSCSGPLPPAVMQRFCSLAHKLAYSLSDVPPLQGTPALAIPVQRAGMS